MALNVVMSNQPRLLLGAILTTGFAPAKLKATPYCGVMTLTKGSPCKHGLGMGKHQPTPLLRAPGLGYGEWRGCPTGEKALRSQREITPKCKG